MVFAVFELNDQSTCSSKIVNESNEMSEKADNIYHKDPKESKLQQNACSGTEKSVEGNLRGKTKERISVVQFQTNRESNASQKSKRKFFQLKGVGGKKLKLEARCNMN